MLSTLKYAVQKTPYLKCARYFAQNGIPRPPNPSQKKQPNIQGQPKKPTEEKKPSPESSGIPPAAIVGAVLAASAGVGYYVYQKNKEKARQLEKKKENELKSKLEASRLEAERKKAFDNKMAKPAEPLPAKPAAPSPALPPPPVIVPIAEKKPESLPVKEPVKIAEPIIKEVKPVDINEKINKLPEDDKKILLNGLQKIYDNVGKDISKYIETAEIEKVDFYEPDLFTEKLAKSVEKIPYKQIMAKGKQKIIKLLHPSDQIFLENYVELVFFT